MTDLEINPIAPQKKLSVSKPIDKLLEGGIEYGTITNLYGPPASGKTNIAMKACVSCIQSGKKAIFIDTEGGFSIERLNQFSNGQSLGDSVILVEPNTWEKQKSYIRSLDHLFSNNEIGLIVVDSIVALWRLELKDNNVTENNRELATQLSILSKLAREHSIPVIITNQIYTDIESGKVELSSKLTVKWWSKNLIELMHAGRTGCRIARIARARNLPEDKQIEFQITANDLKEVSKLRLF